MEAAVLWEPVPGETGMALTRAVGLLLALVTPPEGSRLAQGDDLAPIPGTRREKYLEENVGALDVQLTADELRHLDELLPLGAAVGQRYPEAMMAAVGR